MSNFLELQSPAKLNLFLHIIGRRSDGYHLLQSVFQFIDWCDTIRLRLIPENTIRRIHPLPSVPVEQDLVVRAAQLLKDTYHVKLGIEIALDKNIPMGAGLGGGSSNAATVLIGLNHLWQLKLDLNTLCKLGLQLGADVPFFLFGQNAFVEGIGEKLQPIDLESQDFLVIFPGKSIATAGIFQNPQLTRNHAPITIDGLFASPLSYAGNPFGNDCESVALQICPEVKQALAWIEANLPGSAPRMSGSGSSVFAVLDRDQTPAALERNLQKLPSGWVGRIVRGLNKNPAYNLISSE